MAVVPNTSNGKIEFFDSKTGASGPWSLNSVAIGTTAGAVTGLATKVSTAKTKLAAAVSAKEASKNATAEFNAAVRDMAGAGADIIKQIRAKAATDGDGVYFLAQIPAPATPSPVPPPGKPTDFTVALSEGGGLTLKWKCPNPPGAQGPVYQVSRRTGATGDFALVGATGTRQFVDDTVPAGVASVTYRVVAIRTTAQGPEALLTVCFGVTGAGEATASVVQAPKLAA
jgi:hypothetical protein